MSITGTRDPSEGSALAGRRCQGSYLRRMKGRSLAASLALALLLAVPAWGACPEGDKGAARVEVACSRASAFVNVNISSFRRIGKVTIEVVDASGRTLYKEQGKALTPELVRRLDKDAFPKGHLTLRVTARDFAMTQVFDVQ